MERRAESRPVPAVGPAQGDFAPGALRLTVPGDWRRPGAGGSYALNWDAARDCGFLWPRPAPDDVASFYRVDSYYTHGTGESSDGPPGFLWRVLIHLSWRADRGIPLDPHYWRALAGSAPRRCLDIGCGDGRFLEELRSLGHAVTGIEPDPSARAQAQARGLDVVDGTAEALPPGLNGPFDLILCSHVLEHCLDPDHALRNMRTLLAPGGMLVVEVPNNRCLGFDWFGLSWPWLDVPRHLNFFTRRSLHATAEAAGLRIVRTEYHGYCRQISPHWLDTSQRIAAALRLPRTPGFGRIVGYFLRSFAATSDRKYDSVRIVATPS